MADFISPLSVISSTSFQIPMLIIAYICLLSKLIHNFNLLQFAAYQNEILSIHTISIIRVGMATKNLISPGQNLVTYNIFGIVNSSSYIWSLPPGATGTSTTNRFTVNYGSTAFSCNITVKGHNECGEGAAGSLAVHVNAKPVMPVVTVIANILHSNALGGNQL